MRTNQGVTVIEVLVVLVLAGLLTGFVMLSLNKVNTAEALDKDADLIVSVLNEARASTLSSIGGARYGVHFDADQVVLFQGASYSSSAPTNSVTALHPLVSIQNIALAGGGSNVVFDRITGKTSSSGSLEVALKSATSTYKRITISATGISQRN